MAGVVDVPLPSERGEYQGKLLSAQHRKKQADNDRQLLLNRIALLKKEEVRAWKKIQKTKDRAEEILRMRQENDVRMKEREAQAQRQLERQKEEALRNGQIEEKARRARQQQIDKMINSKREEVQKVRQEAAMAKEEIREQRRSEVMSKQERRAEIKSHEEEVRREREAARNAIVGQNKRNYDSRVEAEEAETKVREKEVGKMERIEMALIQQLKNTQVIQQQAFEQLESALNGDV